MKKLFIILIFITSFSACAQNELYFEEVEFTENTHPVLFKELNPIDKKYPVKNLFDGDFKTCWIISNQTDYSDAFIKLPTKEGVKLNFFQGYGKSKELYQQNARPKKLHISLYYGLLPEGYYSENGFVYEIVDLYTTFDIELKDEYGVQTFRIPIKVEELYYWEKKVKEMYKAKGFPKAEDSGFFISISLDEVYKGTKYKDVCLSELFFNPPFTVKNKSGIKQINKVYLNDAENTVYIDTDKGKKELVYQDKNSVLSLIEISENKEWATVISMPAEIEGRAESNYILLDLINKKQADDDLELRYKDYQFSYDIYFEQIGNKLFLKYSIPEGKYNFVELKHTK